MVARWAGVSPTEVEGWTWEQYSRVKALMLAFHEAQDAKKGSGT